METRWLQAGVSHPAVVELICQRAKRRQTETFRSESDYLLRTVTIE
ncbi:MAG: hypothetical protein FWG83_02820 [Oscillospiraceae bacterium]|nr:hypothetical protein [Oscillospiraceae bacterium]